MCLKYFEATRVLSLENGNAKTYEKKFPMGYPVTMFYNNDGTRFHLKANDSFVCFHTTTNRINMDGSDHCNRCEKAARRHLLAGGSKMRMSEAMRYKYAGFSHKESMNRTAQQQVPRVEEKLKNESQPPPLYRPQAHQSTMPLNRAPLTTVSVAGVKRKMPPKMRLNSKQAHAARKESAETKLEDSQHFKKVTQLCAEEAKKLKKKRKSAEKIVREINEKENVKIC
jgi:hypothetical protein